MVKFDKPIVGSSVFDTDGNKHIVKKVGRQYFHVSDYKNRVELDTWKAPQGRYSSYTMQYYPSLIELNKHEEFNRLYSDICNILGMKRFTVIYNYDYFNGRLNLDQLKQVHSILHK